MPGDGEVVRLRPARRADWDLIRSWLARADIEAWWGPRAATEAEVNIALNSGHALCRIIEAGGVPVGYAHAVDATMWGDELPQDLAPGTWDLDLFIASEEHRGQGVGQAALAQLKDEVFGTTLATAVCVFPSIRNERAVRAYEKAGFRWKRIWNDPHMGPSWFMLAERPR
ncbi:MAG: acetyltransferase [Hyphomicrobium sp.]|uniref:GNAT family N-acetyltransferase n=1 Tax=Hyphomicrobium sp. TaxID=82 RepID=UPI00132954F5|nr:GNAT family N-acetyltransferase [Hyphomicrobium sp.]KAB2939210.1 MAG: acetyltransferase [Hyphomicrobium sp.]MBZ0210408.1 acetyltransferase [Hyphomicrobium sp.]MCZ7594362.1 acetyltransferase [Hyphomicrobium sp.]